MSEAELNDEQYSHDGPFGEKVLENEVRPSILKSPLAASSFLPAPVRILIVDDSIFCRKVIVQMLTRVLEGSNFSLEYRENDDGIDAVNEVKNFENGFDAIFMDNIMVHCDGPEASRQIRTLGYKNLIIGITGNVLDDDVR